jgi:deoxyxylulose-5-phosphate synthase
MKTDRAACQARPSDPNTVRTDAPQTINDPADLRRLSRHQLKPLAEELRAFLLDSVSKTGGHLSSNLGTVELTIALHYVFNTPHDRIVWDVGHQTYPHKILTGRRERMARCASRRHLGLPAPHESEYDTFGTAHLDLDLGRAGHGPGRQDQGETARHRRHRRRRDDRRHGLRSAQQRGRA